MNWAAVAAVDLVLTYGDTIALDRSTFTIPAGKVTSIIGPNGSGKSTLLNAIAGLVEPAGGSLEVAARANGHHRIAYVMQTTKINDALPVSVREVVTMGRYASLGAYQPLRAEDRQAVTDAMERTEIADLASRHLTELSGGQRQRVFVAQGLAQEHELLLLDEPLTGIDLTTAVAIDEIIHEEIEEGCTVILTTHDLSEAEVAHHVLLLSGRVIDSGPPAEVLTRTNLVEAYGAAMIHLSGDRVFIDDAAHDPADARHVHRERHIHTEPSPGDTHEE
jgi:manganese transport system ATP-binding protein